uniref:Uncharacterized protein n=1 Tax=Megaselia scalaris TaxID=36166 RepID=T1GSW9_MEGSC
MDLDVDNLLMQCAEVVRTSATEAIGLQKPACKDKNGDLITNKKEVLMQNNDEVIPPLKTVVDRAIQRLKNNKSAGTDGIPAELLTVAGVTFNDVFHRLLCNIWISEKMPEEWNVNIIDPVNKKEAIARTFEALTCFPSPSRSLLLSCLLAHINAVLCLESLQPINFAPSGSSLKRPMSPEDSVVQPDEDTMSRTSSRNNKVVPYIRCDHFVYEEINSLHQNTIRILVNVHKRFLLYKEFLYKISPKSLWKTTIKYMPSVLMENGSGFCSAIANMHEENCVQ